MFAHLIIAFTVSVTYVIIIGISVPITIPRRTSIIIYIPRRVIQLGIRYFSHFSMMGVKMIVRNPDIRIIKSIPQVKYMPYKNVPMAITINIFLIQRISSEDIMGKIKKFSSSIKKTHRFQR